MNQILLTDAMGIGLTIISVLVVLLIIYFISGIRIVKQTEKFVVQRLGAYHKTWSVGIHFKWTFLERIEKVVSLKETILDFEPQPVITKDNVTMQIDSIIFYQVTDPKLYTYGVQNPEFALENLSATTLRNIVGDLDLDQTLTSRDIINTKMRIILDEATDPWGIKVNRVEVKNIIPPANIREAMEKQMRAEREKREAILIAQGAKESAILRAQGEKESAILIAEGRKEQMLRIAEGEAVATRINKEAEALGIQLVREAKADTAVLTLKSLEALAKVADGQATKIIIPSEIQNLAGLVSSVTEIKSNKKE